MARDRHSAASIEPRDEHSRDQNLLAKAKEWSYVAEGRCPRKESGDFVDDNPAAPDHFGAMFCALCIESTHPVIFTRIQPSADLVG